jgi:DNA repair protein RadC
MNNLFDMTGECRHFSDNELIYNITNSERAVSQFTEALSHNEDLSVEMLFEELTPGRKRVALAAVELYKRIQERKFEKQVVRSSEDVYKIMCPLIGELEVEEFWLLLLNQGSKVIKKIRLSSGGIDGTYVDVRILLKQAIMNNATQIIVAHNHPSGNNQPSMTDNRLTEKIKKVTEIMEIRLADHLVICNHNYYSYSDEGRL